MMDSMSCHIFLWKGQEEIFFCLAHSEDFGYSINFQKKIKETNWIDPISRPKGLSRLFNVYNTLPILLNTETFSARSQLYPWWFEWEASPSMALFNRKKVYLLDFTNMPTLKSI